MAETRPVGWIHPDRRGHPNAAEMTKTIEATDNPQGMTPIERTTPLGRPIGEVTKRSSTL